MTVVRLFIIAKKKKFRNNLCSLLELLVELLLCTRHFASGWESTDEHTNQVPDLLGVF